MLNIMRIRYDRDEHTFTMDGEVLYFELEDEEFNLREDEEALQNIQEIDGKLVRCGACFEYLDRYYRDIAKTDNDEQDYLESLYKKHYELTKTAQQDARRDRGYINYLKDYDSIEPEDYYGLLQKYFTPHTLEYINSKLVFGYLGHEDRTKETDQVICDFLEENPELIETINSQFLTHGAGRHYMDTYDGPEHLRHFLNTFK